MNDNEIKFNNDKISEPESDKIEEQAVQAPVSKKDYIKKEIMEWIKDILFALAVTAVILFFFLPTRVKQTSMTDTLMDGDYLILSRQAYTIFGKPERGDIIVFDSDLSLDSKNNKKLVKRIIAVGGDSIQIVDGTVYLNGQILEEDYLKPGAYSGDYPLTVIPEGYLFCMGDNRSNSLDSRSDEVGFVSEKSVNGKVIFRLFPLSSFGLID